MQKKFVLIGCGRIGQRHAGQISRLGQLKAVCDIVESRADDLAARYSANPFYSLDDLLKNEPDIDVACICTPNGLHAQHSIKALEAGMNVLCEKPLCIKVEDGKQMIAAAVNAGKKLFVVKQNRYNPPVVYLKELLAAGKLGKVLSFQINCFWNRPTSYYVDWKGKKSLDGGTLFTQFSHFIDLLYWLLGDISDIKQVARNFVHPTIEFEDSGIVLFDMASGAIGSMNYTVNTFETNMEGSFTLFAENGTVKIGGQYLNELEYFKVKDLDTPDLPAGNPPNGYGFYQGSMSNHNKVYENLLKALENPSQQIASAEEGLKTVEIIEKIYSL